jgi:hypothetical protein
VTEVSVIFEVPKVASFSCEAVTLFGELLFPSISVAFANLNQAGHFQAFSAFD